MIRLFVALLLIVAAIAFGAYFAAHPGQVEIVWQGWQIDTSVGVLTAAAGFLALIVAALALAVARLRRIPRQVRAHRARRRRRAGDAAMTRGLVALAAGDATEARRHAVRAASLLPDAPIARLLTAEAAQHQGDRSAAREAYAALLARPDSEFLGLRGLIAEAVRAGDDATALPLAARARQLRPAARWLTESLLMLQARAGDWVAARETLVAAARRGALTADEARHQRGVVAYALSQAAEHEGDLRRAAGLAARAQALAPDLTEPALHHARLLQRLGRRRAAAKAIERAWARAPHPDLARSYAELVPDGGAIARAAALQKLTAPTPAVAESWLAVAEALLDAELWGEARRHLDLALTAAGATGAAPSRRLCLAMARLEERVSGEAAAAAVRRWRDRAIDAPKEPAHVCRRCGTATMRWRAQCPRCGGFDTLVREAASAAAAAIHGIDEPRQALAAPLMLPAPDISPGDATGEPRLGGGESIG